jgi:catechol 2,3-dioxygenase-like lactoylglutathione lyase family enzyme
MPLSDLDHVNIRTANLETMIRFYAEVLGLTLGERPPFRFGGAWLYCGEKAAVHLVEVAETPSTGEPRIEHFAFRARGLTETLEALRDNGSPYSTNLIPGGGIRQVHTRDPDGNHIELQFAANETADPALLRE